MGIAEPVIGRRFAPTRWLHPSYALPLRRLLQRQHQSAQIRADDQAGLLAGEREHGAALVGQHNALGAPPDGCAGAALAVVDAVDVRRAVDIGSDGAMEARLEAPKVKP